MTDAPERIWAGPDGGYWSTEDIGNSVDVEYVRADVAAAMVAAALEEAAREIDCGCEHRSEVLAATGVDRWKFCGDPCAALDAREVRALIPDAGAALDRALEEARTEEREACYQKAYEAGCGWQELRGFALSSSFPEDASKHLASEHAAFAVAAAIRARAAELKGEKK